jgi:hypothetical protein
MSSQFVENIVLADYRAERELFKALFQPDCRKPILMFKGISGTGKSTLIRWCLRNVPKDVPLVLIDFKNNNSLVEIFSASTRSLGPASFPNFLALVNDYVSVVEIKGNTIKGQGNRIQVALNAESPDSLQYRRNNLSEVWLDDIRDCRKMVLFILDAFELAPLEIWQWISGTFLGRIPYCNNIRALIAGQKLPDHRNIIWQDLTMMRPLPGVPNPDDWMPVLKATGRRPADADARSWLAGVCMAVKGHPDQIMQLIESLPKADPSDDIMPFREGLTREERS